MEIKTAPKYAEFEVRSNVNDELLHHIEVNVREEGITISDRKGDQIVVMAADVDRLLDVLRAAETLVSLDIENAEMNVESRRRDGH